VFDMKGYFRSSAMREARQGANLIHLDRYTVNQRLLLRSQGY